MPEIIVVLVFIISIFVISSPMYLQNRKILRMADEDLKKQNYEEWKKRIGTNVYIKLFSRIIWGVVILSSFIFNFSKIYAQGFRWINVIILAVGFAFIVWGILGFYLGRKKIQNLK